MPRVALYDDPLFREHDAGFGHPERPERLDAVRTGIREAGLEGRLELIPPRSATSAELLRVHTESHLGLVASTKGRRFRFDPDTEAGPRSQAAALLAAGAVVDAVDRALEGEIDRAFCAVRPPGHHAGSDRAMGFCLFNNVAVAAAHALHRGVERVMIVDFDVHHGNGTQQIFYDDPRVLYVSSHAYPFYPGTGALDEMGEGPGRGFTVNLPLPDGMGDRDFARLYRTIVEPVGRAFDPQLVLVSAGFDAARGDPLAGMDLTAQGYAELTDVCLGIAAGAAEGRALFVLEGGYGLEALAGGAASVTRLLLGEKHTPLPPASGGRVETLIPAYRRQLREHWPILVGEDRWGEPEHHGRSVAF
jgi:acetoin utilization deacetylase AcuC-like enzyme